MAESNLTRAELLSLATQHHDRLGGVGVSRLKRAELIKLLTDAGINVASDKGASGKGVKGKGKTKKTSAGGKTAAAKKTVGTKAVKSASSSAPKATHPSYAVMIIKAIRENQGASGNRSVVSRPIIKKYILANYRVDPKTLDRFFSRTIKRLVEEKALVQVKQSFKFPPIKERTALKKYM